MLSLRAFSNATQRVNYFLQDAGLEGSEKRGFWLGKGSNLIGLRTEARVTAPSFKAVLEGFDPRNGRFLGQRYHADRRAGWDLVFTPHKSISVAALCSRNASAAKRLREAWGLAVDDTFPLIERLAQSHYQGRFKLPTGGLIGAHFTHHRSRHGDPLLHSHLVIANATPCLAQTNTWRGLEPAPIFRHARLLDRAFQRELHRHLIEAGVTAALETNGRAFLPDVMPEAVLRRLSKANEAINIAEESLTPSPMNLTSDPSGLNRANYRNRLNDRLRPAKKDAEHYPSFDSLLSDDEHDGLLASLQRLMPRRKRGGAQITKVAAATPQPTPETVTDEPTPPPRASPRADRQPTPAELSALRGELALRVGHKYLFTHPKLRFTEWLDSTSSMPGLALRQLLLPLEEWGSGLVTNAFTSRPLKSDDTIKTRRQQATARVVAKKMRAAEAKVRNSGGVQPIQARQSRLRLIGETLARTGRMLVTNAQRNLARLRANALKRGKVALSSSTPRPAAIPDLPVVQTKQPKIARGP